MKKLLTALFLIFATAVWAGDFEDGVAAYEKGDFTTAASLFQKVAARGNSSAQYNLAFRYYYGEGVLQDYSLAHMWANLAAVSGDKHAQKARDGFTREMTTQEVSKAQAMAKECLASQFKDCE